jgi:hypothetical protein
MVSVECREKGAAYGNGTWKQRGTSPSGCSLPPSGPMVELVRTRLGRVRRGDKEVSRKQHSCRWITVRAWPARHSLCSHAAASAPISSLSWPSTRRQHHNTTASDARRASSTRRHAGRGPSCPWCCCRATTSRIARPESVRLRRRRSVTPCQVQAGHALAPLRATAARGEALCGEDKAHHDADACETRRARAAACRARSPCRSLVLLRHRDATDEVRLACDEGADVAARLKSIRDGCLADTPLVPQVFAAGASHRRTRGVQTAASREAGDGAACATPYRSRASSANIAAPRQARWRDGKLSGLVANGDGSQQLGWPLGLLRSHASCWQEMRMDVLAADCHVGGSARARAEPAPAGASRPECRSATARTDATWHLHACPCRAAIAGERHRRLMPRL